MIGEGLRIIGVAADRRDREIPSLSVILSLSVIDGSDGFRMASILRSVMSPLGRNEMRVLILVSILHVGTRTGLGLDERAKDLENCNEPFRQPQMTASVSLSGERSVRSSDRICHDEERTDSQILPWPRPLPQRFRFHANFIENAVFSGLSRIVHRSVLE
jgi:hypothetical protein